MTAEEILLKKILRGDECDNIPSIVGNMSEHKLNELIKDSRKLQDWLILNNKDASFQNNQKLIDFKCIPELIKFNITKQIMDNIPEMSENTGIGVEIPVLSPIFLNLPKEFWKESDELKVKAANGYHYIKKCKYNKFYDDLNYFTENYYY
jgi:hypothetical protein